MNDFKNILASKTVWGGLIAVAAGLAGIFGYTIGAEDQVAIVEAVTAIGSAIGGAIAIYGRIKATKKIGK